MITSSPMSSAPPHGGRRVVATALAGAALLLAAGCGSADRPAVASTPSADATSAAASPSSGRSPSATSHPTAVRSSSPSNASPSHDATATSPAPTAARTKQTPGSIHKTVPTRSMKTANPVALGKRTASFGDGVTARITSVRQRYVKAQLPGQLSGASVIFNVVVDNGSSRPLDLNAATVTVTDADGAQASQITSTPAKRLPDLLLPGASGTGTYVFIVPKGSRNPVDVNVTINAELAVVVFHGDIG